MLVVTFPKGMFARHAIKWLLLEHDLNQRVYINSGRRLRLNEDMTYPLDDIDFIQAARDLAHAYGLRLYQCHLGIWKLRPITWEETKAEIFKERGLTP